MQQDTVKKANFCNSRAFAWISTSIVELMILLAAIKDPLFWVAGMQYMLLLGPPIILGLAIRSKSYEPVFSRLVNIFLIVTLLDLLHLR